jgi:hypothetical protein
LDSLKTIELNGRQVADLSALSNLDKLETLDLSWTNVSDISNLSGLESLETLDLSRTKLTDISELSILKSLKTLNLSTLLYMKNVADISALCGLTNLKTLDLSFIKVSDISKLSCLDSLETLSLGGKNVWDISFLNENEQEKLPNLKSLNLQMTCVGNISALSGRTLDSLNLIGTPVTILSGLQNVKILRLTDPGNAINADLFNKYKTTQLKYDISNYKQHLAECQEAEVRRNKAEVLRELIGSKVPTGKTSGTSTLKGLAPVTTGQGGNKPMSGEMIALISISVALVVGGGLSFLYFKQLCYRGAQNTN